LVQALCDAIPNIAAHCLEHHSASFDRLRMRDVAAATGAIVAATNFLILSLSKNAEPHAWDHAAYQPLNSANCLRAKVFWLSVNTSEALK
jgi:hypothetical protein